MKTIVIMMDSLNRHMLDVYNNESWVKTPNINRLAEKSMVFDNHWIGSAPCMPARRDMFTGRLTFLERTWGAIEPFDVTLPEVLRSNKVFTHMVTDHYHYLEIGGEGYCQIFNTWDMHRGQEGDPLVSRVDAPELPKEYYGQVRPQYELNRQRFKSEEDFTGPKTFKAACDWIDDNRKSDNWLLWVEAFDPHEPFDCPDEFLELYNDDYKGPRFDWSTYKAVTEPSDAIEHLKKRYAALLTMTDKWMGKLLDKMDEYSLWDDTLVIFTTDHGHFLGEHGFTGKNFMHAYNELANIPLLVHLPGSVRAGERIGALTQNIDIMPTVLDYFGFERPAELHGKSWKGLIDGTTDSLRESVLYGYFGSTINITDGQYTYFRSPKPDNQPLYMYTAMPTAFRKYIGREVADRIEMGRFLKHTNYPVYKIPQGNTGKPEDSALKPFNPYLKDSLIFDIKEDYAQQNPITDAGTEKDLQNKLREKLCEVKAPVEHIERLGL